MCDERSITKLLRAVESGDPDAEQALFERVYTELRAMADESLRHERVAPQDGDGADLTHDAYTRLEGERFENRKHLFFAYARVMRQILIDRARRSNALKRGGGATRSLIDMHSIAGSDEPGLDALRLSELMERLRSKDERAAQAVELRAFGGLSTYHISELLSLSQRTVRDDLSRASGFITQWASES